MSNLRRRACGIGTMALCLLLTLSACGPAPAAPGSAPAEPARASAEPSVPGPATAKADDFVHITWMYDDMGDPKESQQQLDILQTALNRGGWHVKLDLLPAIYQHDLGGYDTDAYMTPPRWQVEQVPVTYADPDKLLESGATVNVLPLCAQYAPVLAQKNADLLAPEGIPMYVRRDVNKSSLYLLLLRDIAPQRWLNEPPAMSEIVTWLEGNEVSVGQVVPVDSSAVPFRMALQAWVGERGLYPLTYFCVNGGLCARPDDAEIQPMPMETIPGFEDMYRRLFALYKAGRYFEADTRTSDTVGYLSNSSEVSKDFLQAHHIVVGDMVAIPIQGTAWASSASASAIDTILAIPSNSRHVQQVLELAQWLTSREGYDLANYGILNEDYSLQDGCLQWTQGSKMENLHYRFVYDNAMERVNQPANAADIARIMTYAKLPVLNMDKVGEYDKTQYSSPLQAVMEPIRQTNAKLVNDRENLLMGLLPAVEGKSVHPITSADAALEQLRVLSGDHAVDKMAEAYAAELRKLTKE